MKEYNSGNIGELVAPYRRDKRGEDLTQVALFRAWGIDRFLPDNLKDTKIPQTAGIDTPPVKLEPTPHTTSKWTPALVATLASRIATLF